MKTLSIYLTLFAFLFTQSIPFAMSAATSTIDPTTGVAEHEISIEDLEESEDYSEDYNTIEEPVYEEYAYTDEFPLEATDGGDAANPDAISEEGMYDGAMPDQGDQFNTDGEGEFSGMETGGDQFNTDGEGEFGEAEAWGDQFNEFEDEEGELAFFEISSPDDVGDGEDGTIVIEPTTNVIANINLIAEMPEDESGTITWQAYRVSSDGEEFILEETSPQGERSFGFGVVGDIDENGDPGSVMGYTFKIVATTGDNTVVAMVVIGEPEEEEWELVFEDEIEDFEEEIEDMFAGQTNREKYEELLSQLDQDDIDAILADDTILNADAFEDGRFKRRNQNVNHRESNNAMEDYLNKKERDAANDAGGADDPGANDGMDNGTEDPGANDGMNDGTEDPGADDGMNDGTGEPDADWSGEDDVAEQERSDNWWNGDYPDGIVTE